MELVRVFDRWAGRLIGWVLFVYVRGMWKGEIAKHAKLLEASERTHL